MAEYTGYVRITLERKADKTVIKDCYVEGACKITRSVYLDESGQACLYLMNPGGGYLAGDTYKQELCLKKGAHAIVTTQSSTKIYKSEGLPAVMDTEIDLGADSLIAYIPDPTIAYQNARYRQNTVVRMEAGATLIYADMFTPGWAADGTLFCYDWIRSRMEVYRQNQRILLDHLKLVPDEAFAKMGYMEGFTHLGSLIVISDRVTPAFVEEVQDVLGDWADTVRAGISRLAVPGFAVRLLATSTQALEKAIGLIHSRMRSAWFGWEAVFLRKY